MGSDLPGKFLGVILAFILVIVAPFVNTVVTSEMIDRRMIITDVCSFIDSVVDSREVTDAAVDELNIKLGSYGVICSYDVTRLARDVNPDPLGTGTAYVTFTQVDDNKNYNQGDKIQVHVYTVSTSTTHAVAQRIASIFIPDLDATITARVR